MLSPFLAAAVLALALQGTGAVVPRELVQGDQSHIDSPRQVVVRTQAEWESLWRQHNPDVPRPAVDFRSDMVLALFLGSRPTPGHSVNIVSVTSVGEDLIVRYRETRPPPGGVAIQLLTFPFHMVVMPARPGRVSFSAVD